MRNIEKMVEKAKLRAQDKQRTIEKPGSEKMKGKPITKRTTLS